tara:strand:- start:440 stop:772 length:333 start_codon:yes stop_codon:yes gene_type:complete
LRWARTNEQLEVRHKLVHKSKYPVITMIFDYISWQIDLKQHVFNLRWRLHSTICRYESKKKYQRVLNKLVEEAIEYVCAREADFVDPIDRQLVQFLKTYLYAKQNKPSED